MAFLSTATTKSGASYFRFSAAAPLPPMGPLDAKTLHEFGYAYESAPTSVEERATHAARGALVLTSKTRLLQLPAKTDGFAFRGEAHYTALNYLVRDEVRRRLVAECGLVELDAEKAVQLMVPERLAHAAVHIFHGLEAFMSTAPLLVIVHGSGDVRAGL